MAIAHKRIRIETAVVRLLIKKILAKDLLISVWDWHEGDMIAQQCTDSKTILEDVFCIETPLMRMYDMQGQNVGSVMLCPGNGADIIADHSESMEEVCKEVWGRFEEVR